MIRKISLALIFLLLAALVPTKVVARRATIFAASCARNDVASAISTAVDGDTVQIPACTLTDWTTGIGLSKNISLIGSGVGVTNIRWAAPTSGGLVGQMLQWNVSSSVGSPLGFARLAHMSIDGGVGASTDGPEDQMIKFGGNADKLVIDHLFIAMRRQESFRFDGYLRGVVAEVEVDVKAGFLGAVFRVDHTSWGNFSGNNYGGAGDGSWSAPTSLGTQETLVFEDINVARDNVGVMFEFALDGWNGMRYVVRFSDFTDTSIGNHGTESGGRERGARQFEYYNNIYRSIDNPIFGVSATRGGTGVAFDNQAISTAPNGSIQQIFAMDTDRGEYPPPHPAGAYYPWYLCGTINLTSITRSGNIATATSSVAHFLGGGQGPPLGHVEVRGASDALYNGEFEVISTPTSTTFTYAMAGTPAANASGSLIMRSPYDQNSDTSGVLCLDQVGAGKQDHTFGPGVGGVDVPNGLPWNTQDLEPVYVWNNLNQGSLQPAFESNGSDVMIENVHYYNQNTSFTGATGVGRGTLGNRPASCTTGVAYWATDVGEWNSTNGATPDGQLYKCTSTNTWSLFYKPLTYPHPLLGPPQMSVSITSPTTTANYDTTATQITIGGTATSPTGTVQSISWANDRGGSGSCTGTTTWTCSNIPLAVDINVVTITGVDDVASVGEDILNVQRLNTVTPPADAFNRANWPTMGPWWTHQGGTLPYQILNSRAAGIAQNFDCAFWNQETSPVDQRSEATVIAVSDTNQAVRVTVRAQQTISNQFDNYFLSTDGLSGAGHTFIGKFIDGQLSALQNIATTFIAGDVMKLTIEGNTLKAFKNDIQIGTDQASGSELTAGQPGVCFYGANSALDDWSGGEIVEGTPEPPAPKKTRLRIVGGFSEGLASSAGPASSSQKASSGRGGGGGQH